MRDYVDDNGAEHVIRGYHEYNKRVGTPAIDEMLRTEIDYQ